MSEGVGGDIVTRPLLKMDHSRLTLEFSVMQSTAGKKVLFDQSARSLMDLVNPRGNLGLLLKLCCSLSKGLNCCLKWADDSGLESSLFRFVHVDPAGPLGIWSSFGCWKTCQEYHWKKTKNCLKSAAQVKSLHRVELRMVKFFSLPHCVYSSGDFALSYLSGFNCQIKLSRSIQCSTVLVPLRWLKDVCRQVIWMEYDPVTLEEMDRLTDGIQPVWTRLVEPVAKFLWSSANRLNSTNFNPSGSQCPMGPVHKAAASCLQRLYWLPLPGQRWNAATFKCQ